MAARAELDSLYLLRVDVERPDLDDRSCSVVAQGERKVGYVVSNINDDYVSTSPRPGVVVGNSATSIWPNRHGLLKTGTSLLGCVQHVTSNARSRHTHAQQICLHKSAVFWNPSPPHSHTHGFLSFHHDYLSINSVLKLWRASPSLPTVYIHHCHSPPGAQNPNMSNQICVT